MSIIEDQPIYDELLTMLADGFDPQKLATFRLPESAQQRLELLLERNRNGDLSDSDRAELDSYEKLEHVFRMLKARTLGKRSK
jgi:hypothetical protein